MCIINACKTIDSNAQQTSYLLDEASMNKFCILELQYVCNSREKNHFSKVDV